MSKKKKREQGYYTNVRQQFLHTFFGEGDDYAEKEVNGFWLVKHWNGDTKKSEVAIYSPESFKQYKAYARGEAMKDTPYAHHVERFQYLIGEF